MTHYQIADLERLTGIKSHTIRIWEKRYGLIEPKRTSTNIRYYDDAQVRKLLNVSTLLEAGMKISKIAELSDKEIYKQITNLHAAAGDDIISVAYVNDLTSSMLFFDEPAFEKTLLAAIVRLGMFNMMLKVVYPFLRKTGMMWALEQALPVQEHFASAIIRRKLIAAIDGLPMPSVRSKIFVLFLPESEWHEVGLLMADFIIRSKGYKTIYLSQNVPFSNLSDVVHVVKPTHLLTLYITRQGHEKINKELLQLAKKYSSLEIILAGNLPEGSLPPRAKNLRFLNSPEELAGIL